MRRNQNINFSKDYYQVLEMVELFLKNNVNVNEKFSSDKPVFFTWTNSNCFVPAGQSPLHFALGLKEKIKYLMDPKNGTLQSFLKTKKHLTATQLQEDFKNIERIIEKLIASKNINLEIGESQNNTPLHDACANIDLKSIALLVQHGANTSAMNKHAHTPRSNLNQIVGITSQEKEQVDQALQGLYRSPSQGICIIS